MAYHIGKKGTLERCFAIFRKCPCSVHFDTVEDGSHYMRIWEENKIEYPELSDEAILEPQNGFIMRASELKDTSITDGLYISKDSFIIIKNGRSSMEAFHEMIKENVKEGIMTRRDFARGLETSLNDDRGWIAGDLINARSFVAQLSYGRDREGSDESFLESAFKEYDKLAKRLDNNMASICLAFGYNISDKVLEDGTPIRIFSREEPLSMDLVKEIKDNAREG